MSILHAIQIRPTCNTTVDHFGRGTRLQILIETRVDDQRLSDQQWKSDLPGPVASWPQISKNEHLMNI